MGRRELSDLDASADQHGRGIVANRTLTIRAGYVNGFPWVGCIFEEG
jgi:hypothetical protein